MKNSKNPLSETLTWFNSIDPAHQADISAFTLLASCKDFELSAPVQAFQSWLMEENLHPLVTLGRAGLLRTVISSCFTRPRARPETWAVAATNNAVVAAKARTDGNNHLANILTDANRTSGAQQERWKHTINTWQTLIDGALSESELEDWFNNSM
jgi:hypothetical protein